MYSLILLSAGRGTRFGKETPKQYLSLAGKPMIVHTLERVNAIKDIGEIVIVCEKEYIERIQSYINDYRITKKVIFVQGGLTRQESVYEGLKKASFDDVIVHEAARPLVTKKEFLALIDCKETNVSYVYEIPYTVLKKDNDACISGILERKELVNIQLPQKFEKKTLMDAHQLALKNGQTFTEDASMVYYAGEKVFCLQGTPYNVKMTEYVDLLYGEMLIKEEFIKEEA